MDEFAVSSAARARKDDTVLLGEAVPEPPALATGDVPYPGTFALLGEHDGVG